MVTVDDLRYILSRAPERRGACRGQPAMIASQSLMALPERRDVCWGQAVHYC